MVHGVRPPSKHDFDIVMKAFLAGGCTGRKGLPGVGSAKKLRRMKFCLAEGHRHVHRQALRNAKSISFFQDGRRGRLALRYKSADTALTARSGCLGQVSLAIEINDLGALGIAEGTTRILDKFCTRLHGAPFCFRQPLKRKVDSDLRNHIRNAVELVSSDAAADERRASKVLKRGIGPGQGPVSDKPPEFVNLIIHNLDKAHSARRITSRLWKADPFLSECADAWVLGKTSICQQIQHSEIYAARFAKHAKLVTDSPITNTAVKNMSAAKHRFESTQKPFARSVVYFDALVKTAVEMMRERKKDDKFGRGAADWLRHLDEERVLQVAMMADGGDEHARFLRFFDDEDFDCAQMPRKAQELMDRIHTLFHSQACFRLGYTATCLQRLQEPRTFIIDGTPKTIGGSGRPRSDIRQRCLARMRNWVFLSKLTIDAEFPSSDLLYAFSIFDLEVGQACPPGDVVQASPPTRHLERLAATFHVEVGDLTNECCAHQPIAFNFVRKGFSGRDAWKKAVETTQRMGASKATCPALALRPVLCRYVAWGCSTSGVERLFASWDSVAPPSRSGCSESLIDDDVCLISADPNDDFAAIQHARWVWAKLYGCARTAIRCPRVDAGIRRMSKLGTEQAFIRKRRADVEEELKTNVEARRAASVAPTSADIPDNSHWHGSHTREALFQLEKEQLRVLEALESGTLDVSDVDPASAALLAEFLCKGDRLDKRYFAGQAQRRLATRPVERPSLLGKSLFLEDGVTINGLPVLLTRGRMRLSSDRGTADVFVVKDIAHPGQRSTLHAVLGGCVVCSIDFLTSLGQSGPALVYKMAVAKKKSVWASDEFQAKHRVLHDIIKTRSGMPGSRWTALESKAKVLAEARKRGNSSGLLIFTGVGEQKSEEFRQVKWKLVAGDIIPALAELSQRHCVMNVCGQ